MLTINLPDESAGECEEAREFLLFGFLPDGFADRFRVDLFI
jgi:hypothetical protein